MLACDHAAFPITPEDVRRSRRAYFANVSYIDEKIGEILGVLERGGMAENTAVVFLSDHGDMLGERGLWFKMSFREGSARVPLMLAAPGLAPGRRDHPGLHPRRPAHPRRPRRRRPGRQRRREPPRRRPPRPGAHGIRRRRHASRPWSPSATAASSSRSATPTRRSSSTSRPTRTRPLNLAADPAHAATLARLTAAIRARWDLARFDRDVRESQARRRIVYEALRNGAYFPWDYQPLQRASERYMRNHMDLNVLEASQRYPRPD